MKRSSLLLISFFVLSGLFSCKTYQDVTPRSLGASKDDVMMQKSLIGEIKVDINKKLTGSAKVLNRSTEDAMNLAYWDAIEKGGAHTIVDPVYKVTKTGFSTTAEVTGYYGEFVSIETASEQDLLNYIRVKLLTGTGILGVSFEAFSRFYYSLAEVDGVNEEDILEEWELRMFYDEQVAMAQGDQGISKDKDFAKSVDADQNSKGKKAGKIILTYLLLSVIVGGTITLILNFL